MRGDVQTYVFHGDGLRLVGGLRDFVAAAGADSDGAVIEALGEPGYVVAAGSAPCASGKRPTPLRPRSTCRKLSARRTAPPRWPRRSA